MASYRDWEMLNRSIKDVGDSVLERKMFEEKKREFDANQGLQRDELGQRKTLAEQELAQRKELGLAEQTARGDQFKAQQAHWEKLEQAAQLGTTLKALGDHTDRIGKSIQMLGEQVRSGALKNEDAAAYVKSAIESAPETIKAEMLKAPEIKAIMEGKVDFSKIGAPGRTETAQTRNIDEFKKLRAELKAAEAAGDTEKVEMLKEMIAMVRKPAEEKEDPTAFETVTESGTDPDTNVNRSRSWKQPRAQDVAPQATGAKKLDLKTAQDFLVKANGDKNKARELAKQAGYTW